MESRQHTDAHSRLIAITGPPGSGKTTLANALAKQFGLPLLSRDAIKEAAFDTFGWHDREWSKRVGALSYELLCHTIDLLLGTGGRFLVDTTLSPASAARINQLLVAHMTQATQVLLVVPPEVCLTRLRERHAVGDRHPGHADHQTLMDPDLLEGFDQPAANYPRLRGRLLLIDPTSANGQLQEAVAAQLLLG